ncbi:hypothetical protein SUGI_0014610 [Cryptomeria japonica]|nr:hypothetical protein SUGI_0014610 [Cryptomeria japonica]
MEEDEDISREEKRKSMRVSFSDITSVHFFDRDDDYQSPPEKQSATPQEQVKEFFGPVSLWHIGSESAARSLPEHDITLDSTEFSQHFSRLASLETENFRQASSTPTDESSQENLMILTNNLELNTQPGSVQAPMDGDNAEDMNIIGQSPSEHSCAIISPNIDALMVDRTRQVQSNKKPDYSKLGLKKISGVMEQVNLFTSGFMVDKSEKMNQWYTIDLRNEQLTSQGTNDDHKLLNSNSSSQVLRNVDMDISPVCNKVNISSGCYPLQTRNTLLEYCNKGSKMGASGPLQCAMSVSPKTHDLIFSPTDNLSLEECHNSEISSRAICPEKCQNQIFSGEWRGRDTVKTLQPLLSSSSGCVRTENLCRWQDGDCDNLRGNILKVKKKHTKEFLAPIEPSTAIEKGSLNAADELEANCKDHTTFCDEPPKCLKNENADPSFNVELKDQDRDSALHTQTSPDSNLSVACKSTGLTRSVRNYSDTTVALSASLANGNISLRRSILAPISLNLEDTRLLSTMTEAKTPMKGHEYKDTVPKGLKMTADFVNKMLPLSPFIANFSCKQLEQQKLQGQLTPCLTKKPMMMQQGRQDINHKTDDGKYISETDFSTLQTDSEGNYGKHNWIQILELHDGNPSINFFGNGGLTHESNLEQSKIVEISFQCMRECSIHLAEKQTVAGTTMDVQKDTEIASAKLIEVPRGSLIGVQGLCLPVITKPRTLQQCLSFIFATRPQICLLEDTVEQLKKDIAKIRSLPSMKNQLIDEKNPLAVKNKPWLPRSFRMGHIKWLQQILAYEKFKSRLLLAKEDELKKIVQNLQSGLQAVENLKVKALCLDKKALLEKQIDSSVKNRNSSVKKLAINDERKDPTQALKVDIEKQIKSFASKKADYEGKLNEVQKENLDSCEKVIIMKQELNVLDSKIRDLCELYSTVCSGNHIPKKEIIRSLEYNVKTANKKLLNLLDMLLWKLKNIKSKPKEHFIELNYLDIICQRFWINGDEKFAKASTGYSISYETVERVFPFMSASVAFDVVFASKQSFKAVDVGALWQTIQEMSFLFGSLIDVLQEVQLCRTKFENLSFARFHCVDGSELHLQLTFLKYTSGLKVVVILDMKDLKCGMCPCDVLPFQLELDQHGQQTKCTLTAEEIEESIKSLSSGFSRLRIICECFALKSLS